MLKLKNKIFSVAVALLMLINIISPSIISAQEIYKSGRSNTIKLGVYSDQKTIYESLEVPYEDGDTAYTLLKRVLGSKVNAIGSEDTIYVAGIDGRYEFDGGTYSGWNYAVNRWMPNYSAGIYKLEPGDEMIWHYTLNLGEDIDRSYSKFDEFINSNSSSKPEPTPPIEPEPNPPTQPEPTPPTEPEPNPPIQPEPTPPIEPEKPENKLPTIIVSHQTLKVGDVFNPMDIVSAYDDEDGDITNNIKIIENNVVVDNENKVNKAGKYSVTYKVTDSYGESVEKNITVTVEKTDLIESELVGSSRYSTAIKISNKGWSKSDNIVLVNSSSIVDALSATPFAKMKDAPILLTESNKLNEETKKEIERLNAKNVYVIGGNGAISNDVVSDLKSMKLNTDRISGDDRYQTSLAIASRLENISEIAVVNGVTGLADAVSIAPIAASKNMPIILASPQSGIKTFEEFIKNNNVKISYIIGGENAISNNIKNTLKNPIRLAGNNRNETNAKIIEKFYTKKELKNIFVAKDGMKNQNGLIDALSAGVLAAKEESPIVIVGNELNAEQKRVLNLKTPSEITKVGGNGNENAFNQLLDLFKKLK